MNTLEAVVASDGTRSRGCAPRLACEEIEQQRLDLVIAEAAALLASHPDEATAANAPRYLPSAHTPGGYKLRKAEFLHRRPRPYD